MDADVLHLQVRRFNLDPRAATELSDLNVGAPRCHHRDSRRHRAEVPGQIYHCVSAITAAELAHVGDEAGVRGEVTKVDRLVSTERPRHHKAFRYPIDRDDEGRTHLPRDRRGGHAVRAGALDHDAISRRDVGLAETRDDLREGTVHTGNCAVVEAIGDAHHLCGRRQDDEVCEGTVEVRWLLDCAVAMDVSVRAGARDPAPAGAAPTARREETEDDAVTIAQ